MSRTEENKKMQEYFEEKANENRTGTYEEIATWHREAMTSALMDISKSLAVIADKLQENKTTPQKRGAE